jgi:hypothetical protein
MNNGFPNDAYATTDNEILLYIQQANAFGLVGQVWGMAKITQVMEVPDSYMVTAELPALQQEEATGDWYTALPQPPVGLPLGYSINRIYAADAVNGSSQDFYLIKAKRVGRRANLPLPGGVRAWIDYTDTTILRCRASDNQPLSELSVYVQMPITRVSDITLPMNLPEDAVENIFNNVVTKLTQRYQQPKNVINNDLPAGNNTLKS